jgi:hypothetical protein
MMDWISANWVWILIAIAFVAMHMFGHGCHGGHDRHGVDDERKDHGATPGRDERLPSGHQH